MAKIALIDSNQGHFLLYSVEQAVGPACPNTRTDVLLVQYFLREAFKTSVFAAEPFFGPEVDGKAGKETFAAILHFQKVMKKRGSGIATDNRVDPIAGEQVRGSISGTQYTIIFLNQAYRTVRPNDYGRVSKAGDCPAELRPKIVEPEFLK